MLEELLTSWIPPLLMQLIGEAVEDEAQALAAKEDLAKRKRASIIDDGLQAFMKVGRRGEAENKDRGGP